MSRVILITLSVAWLALGVVGFFTGEIVWLLYGLTVFLASTGAWVYVTSLSAWEVVRVERSPRPIELYSPSEEDTMNFSGGKGSNNV